MTAPFSRSLPWWVLMIKIGNRWIGGFDKESMKKELELSEVITFPIEP